MIAMKICISGLTASGKTTVGARLAEYLGIKHIGVSYKRDVKSNAELMGVLKNSKPKYAKDFDAEVKAMARGADCVVTTWLSPWMIKDSTLNVRLYADEKERAGRVMKQQGISRAAAAKYVSDKDRLTIAHFKRIYKIDVMDDSKFDISINTGKLGTDKVAAIIALAAMLKEKKKFE